MSYDDLQIFSYLIVTLYLLFSLRKKCKLKTIIVSIVVINVCITIFARLFWVLENYRYFISGDFGIDDVLRLKLTGLKIIGVLIGDIVGIAILSKIYKQDKRHIINSGVEAMFLGAAYTKIVCTVCGVCCLGKVIENPWFGIYTRHLTALYEVIVWLIGFFLLHLLKNKTEKDSTRISIVVIYYVIIRMFILEGLYEGGIFLGSLTSRIVYCLVIAICLGIIIINKKQIKIKINKNIKRILYLILVLIIIITVAMLWENSKKVETEKNKTLETEVIENVQILEDGTKSNTSNKLKETKTFEGMEINNIKLTSRENVTLLSAIITNKANIKQGGYPVNIKMIDKEGNEIIKIVAFIGELEVGESSELNVSTTSNFVNAYDLSISK